MKTLRVFNVSVIMALSLISLAHAQPPPVAMARPEPNPANRNITQQSIGRYPYHVRTSGSYIVTSVPHRIEGSSAIIVHPEATDVHIDLNGFTLTGDGEQVGMLLPAIQAAREAARISVANGVLKGWKIGVLAESADRQLTGAAGPDLIEEEISIVFENIKMNGCVEAGAIFRGGAVQLIDSEASVNDGGGIVYDPPTGYARFEANRLRAHDNGGDALGIRANLGVVQLSGVNAFNNRGRGIAVEPSDRGDIIPNGHFKVEISGCNVAGAGLDGIAVTAMANALDLFDVQVHDGDGMGILIQPTGPPPDPIPYWTIRMKQVFVDNLGTGGVGIVGGRGLLDLTDVGSSGNGGHGIMIMPGIVAGLEDFESIEMTNTRANANAGHGVTVDNKEKITIHGSHTDNNARDGMHLVAHELAHVVQGQSGMNGGRGFWIDSRTLRLSECSATSNTLAGVQADLQVGGWILDSTFERNGGAGIDLAGPTGMKVGRNAVHSNRGTGIRLTRARASTVEQNHVAGAGVGVEVQGASNIIHSNTVLSPGNAPAFMVGPGNELAPLGSTSSSLPKANLVLDPVID